MNFVVTRPRENWSNVLSVWFITQSSECRTYHNKHLQHHLLPWDWVCFAINEFTVIKSVWIFSHECDFVIIEPCVLIPGVWRLFQTARRSAGRTSSGCVCGTFVLWARLSVSPARERLPVGSHVWGGVSSPEDYSNLSIRGVYGHKEGFMNEWLRGWGWNTPWTLHLGASLPQMNLLVLVSFSHQTLRML